MTAEYNVEKRRSSFIDAVLSVLMNSDRSFHKQSNKCVENSNTIYETKSKILPENGKKRRKEFKATVILLSLPLITAITCYN